jgi:hypothetical protein
MNGTHSGVLTGVRALMFALLLSGPAHTDGARPLGVPGPAVAPGAPLAASQAPPDATALDQLLARAGEYVVRFDTAFSNVVAEERYVQEATETRMLMAAPTPRGFGGSPTTTAVIRRERCPSRGLLLDGQRQAVTGIAADRRGVD